MENGVEKTKKIEKIKKEVDEKVLRDTEYTVKINGKWEKFAYYGMKDNGRLILLNTRYGTLTPMSASYFIKLISGKYPCSKRPYKVEYPDGMERDHPVPIEEKKKEESQESKRLRELAYKLNNPEDDLKKALERDERIPSYLANKIIEYLDRGDLKGLNLAYGVEIEKAKELLRTYKSMLAEEEKMRKTAFCLKTLPINVDCTVSKQLRITADGMESKEEWDAYTLGERLLDHLEGRYKGAPSTLILLYLKAQDLLKGTQWEVK